MKIGVVEMGGDWSKRFQTELAGMIETATFEIKKALDLFDVLAYARKMIDYDQVVLIVKFSEEDQDLRKIFLQGLATLESETGKAIFKCFYHEDDDPERLVKQLAMTFYNSIYHPEKLEQKEEGKEEEPFTLQTSEEEKDRKFSLPI